MELSKTMVKRIITTNNDHVANKCIGMPQISLKYCFLSKNKNKKYIEMHRACNQALSPPHADTI